MWGGRGLLLLGSPELRELLELVVLGGLVEGDLPLERFVLAFPVEVADPRGRAEFLVLAPQRSALLYRVLQKF